VTYGALLLAALLGAPLFAVFGGLALAAYHGQGLDASLIVAELSRLASMPLLQTLPMFALAGYVLARGQTSARMLRLARAALGWLPGGTVLLALVLLMIFTAFTGASGVSIVALGGLLLPALLQEGYGERFALGLVTSGGNTGVLLVPSLPLILYAIIANPIAGEATVDRLFLAGLLPALLSVVALGAYGMVSAWRQRVPRAPFAWRELGRALWAARWELPLPFVVLGGIYSGKLVVSEAAVITAAYAIVVEVFLYREVRLRDLAAVATESMLLVGGILVILGLGMALTNWMVDQDVPARLLAFAERTIHSRLTFLLMLNVLLLIVGCLMDIYTAVIVVVPLLLPVAAQFGVHPVHLGTIFLTNLAIGYCTPPVGMNLFIASLRFERPIWALTRASLPYLAILLAVLALVTYVPALSLWMIPK
jgi:tripartite ATP-independent transporter DctM subunit